MCNFNPTFFFFVFLHILTTKATKRQLRVLFHEGQLRLASN